MKLSLDLPPNISDIPRLLTLLNDRLRSIAEKIGFAGALEQDLDAGRFRISNLGQPKAPGDALSLGAADLRYAQAGAVGGSTTTVVQGQDAILLSASGTLAIQSSVTPLVSLQKRRQASEVVALLKQAPTGGNFSIEVVIGGSAWAVLTVPSGQTSGRIDASALPPISAESLIAVNVTAVGLTFPGSDLTTMIRLV